VTRTILVLSVVGLLIAGGTLLSREYAPRISPPPAPTPTQLLLKWAPDREPSVRFNERSEVPTIVGRTFTDANGTTWVMREPHELIDISDEVREHLGREQCRIPVSVSDNASSIFWGALRGPQTRDLAILCVQGRIAIAFVFWSGAMKGYERIRFDGHFLPGQHIRLATRTFIAEHLRSYASIDDRMPKAATHEGIANVMGCCSVVHYWHRGIWVRAPGAD
jgi:hypothetical protein